MVPINKVFMVSTKENFTRELIKKIKISGFSNFPIYIGENK